MRILGIDPGYGIVGYGVVSYDGAKYLPLSYGVITTEAGERFAARLVTIYNDLNTLIEQFKPDSIGIERLYSTNNHKTVIDVAQARGVTVLAIKQHQIPLSEYTPLQVKQAVVGYGRAEKHQVMEMTRRILKLDKIPRPDDAADGLAIAICHGHYQLGKELEKRQIKAGDTI